MLVYPRARRRVLKVERDSWKFFYEKFVRRSLIASPDAASEIKFTYLPTFDKTSFDTWWVTGGVMCVLKCFSRFIVSFYVKDSVFLESFPFINNFVKECDFLV